MNIIQIIHKYLSNQRFRAILIRGLAQVVVALPPLVVLAKYGASGAGLFAILIAVAGLSLVLEWGFSYKLQNEVSRGENKLPYTLHWFLLKSGLLPHLLINVCLGLLFCRFSAILLPRVFPPQIAQVLGGNPNALLALVLITASSAAIYHGRSIIFGLGHLDRGFLISLLGAGFSLALVVVGSFLGVSVTLIAVFALSAALFERLLGCAYCFLLARPLERHSSLPRPENVSEADPNRGWKVAFMFFYLQILSMAANNIDAIYAGRSNSLTAVGEFSFLLKLFGIPLLIVNVLNTSAWPRLAVESRNSQQGARQTLLHLLRSNLVIVIGGGLLIVASAGFIYKLITRVPGNLLVLSLLMLFDFSFQAVRGVMTTFVNAAEIIGINLIGNTVFSLAAVFLKVHMVDRFGINGLVLADLMSYVVFLLPFHLAAVVWIEKHSTNVKALKISDAE